MWIGWGLDSTSAVVANFQIRYFWKSCAYEVHFVIKINFDLYKQFFRKFAMSKCSKMFEIQRFATHGPNAKVVIVVAHHPRKKRPPMQHRDPKALTKSGQRRARPTWPGRNARNASLGQRQNTNRRPHAYIHFAPVFIVRRWLMNVGDILQAHHYIWSLFIALCIHMESTRLRSMTIGRKNLCREVRFRLTWLRIRLWRSEITMRFRNLSCSCHETGCRTFQCC